MIAYMIRRAEELNQMRYPLDTQYALLSHEIKWRLVNWSEIKAEHGIGLFLRQKYSEKVWF